MNTLLKRISAFLSSKTSYLLITQVFSIIFSFFVVVFISRYYSTEEYGFYSFTLSIISWVELVLTIGFYNYIISIDIRHNKRKLKITIILQALISVIMTLLFVICSSVLSKFFKESNLKVLFIIAAFDFLPFALYSSIAAIFNELKKFKKQSFVSFLYGFFKILFIIIFSVIFKNISFVVFGIISASIISLIIGLFILFSDKEVMELLKKSDDSSLNTTISIDLLFSIIIVISIGILTNIDFWLIKFFVVDNDFIGYYGIISNLSKSFYILLNVLFLKLYVSIKRNNSWKECFREKKIKNELLIIMALYLFYVIFIFTLLPYFIQIFFGVKYIPAGSLARQIMPIQGAFFITLLMLQGSFYLKKAKFTVMFFLMSVVLFFMLGFFLFPIIQITGIIITYLSIIVFYILIIIIQEIYMSMIESKTKG